MSAIRRSAGTVGTCRRWAMALLLAGTSGPAFAQDASAPALPGAPVAAVTPASPPGDFVTERKVAEILIVEKQFDQARAKLLVLEKMQPGDNEVQFLLALLDM